MIHSAGATVFSYLYTINLLYVSYDPAPYITINFTTYIAASFNIWKGFNDSKYTIGKLANYVNYLKLFYYKFSHNGTSFS